MKNNLHNELNFISYVHSVTKFSGLNDEHISKIRKNQGNKLYNIILSNSYHNSGIPRDSDKVIFTFSDHVLNATERSFLSKGLNFVISSKNRNYADFILPFELLYRGVDY